jgi:hypothetical protein
MWLPAGGGGRLADDLADGEAQGVLVFGREGAEGSDDEALFEGGDDWLDVGGLEQSGGLLVARQTSPRAGVGRS